MQKISVYEGTNITIMQLTCPKCSSVVDVKLADFVMAINLQDKFWCAHCWHNFKVVVVLLDPRSPTLREPVQTEQNGDREAIYHECGNCGVPRFAHGSILEACPNCGDDETDLSLIDEVP